MARPHAPQQYPATSRVRPGSLVEVRAGPTAPCGRSSSVLTMQRGRGDLVCGWRPGALLPLSPTRRGTRVPRPRLQRPYGARHPRTAISAGRVRKAGPRGPGQRPGLGAGTGRGVMGSLAVLVDPENAERAQELLPNRKTSIRSMLICPQRDSNPRYHLERVATWAASRWGRPGEDSCGRSYHPWPPGRLAQLVERLPYTQVAAGSSPAPPIARPPAG
jgi:hypothetical protein